MSVQIHRLEGEPPFEDDRKGWWGYRVAVDGRAPFDYWVLGADYAEIGDGYVQREANDERLADGRSPFGCNGPHVDDYYDAVWDLVIEDLHRSGHPSLA